MPEKGSTADPSAAALMKRFELLVSRMLLGGVAISMATVFLGLLVMFAHHPDYLRSAADLRRLTSPGAASPKTIADVARGVVAGRGQAVVTLGLLLLIATPILRVAVSAIAFALQRDRIYTAISAAVLAVLLISFLLGKAG